MGGTRLCVRRAIAMFMGGEGGREVTGRSLRSHDDVVDGDVDEFDKEADESHDGEPNGGRNRNLLELFSVWLCAPLDQSDGVLGELLEGVDELHDLIHLDVVLELFGLQASEITKSRDTCNPM